MDHDWSVEIGSLRAVPSGIRSTVLEVEALWKVEVELNGTTLPIAFEGISELKVELPGMSLPDPNGVP